MTNKHQGVSADLDTQIEEITEELAQYWHPRNTAINRANKSLIEAQAAIKNLIHKEVVKELESFLEHYRQFSWTGEEMKDMDYNPCGEALKARISHLQALQALQGGKDERV